MVNHDDKFSPFNIYLKDQRINQVYIFIDEKGFIIFVQD